MSAPQIIVHILGRVGVDMYIAVRCIVIEWFTRVKASIQGRLGHGLITLSLEIIL